MPAAYHSIYPLLIHHATRDTAISLSKSLPVLEEGTSIFRLWGNSLNNCKFANKAGGRGCSSPNPLLFVIKESWRSEETNASPTFVRPFQQELLPPLILFSIFQNDRYSTWFTNAYLSIGEAWVYLFSVVVNAVNLFMQVFFTIMYSDLEVCPCCKGANFFSAITSIRSTYATS